jgi:hypothetical protein
MAGYLWAQRSYGRVFNDTESEVLWLVIGAPEAELERGEEQDKTRFYPIDPKQLPKELAGAVWPPKA